MKILSDSDWQKNTNVPKVETNSDAILVDSNSDAILDPFEASAVEVVPQESFSVSEPQKVWGLLG